MIASGQTIRDFCVGNFPMIEPFFDRTIHDGMTFGLGPAGYDVRIDQDVTIWPGGFVLASTMEQFNIPACFIMEIADKSTWARRGLAVQNSRAEPGWKGFLTLELTNHGGGVITIKRGAPIAHCLFQFLDQPADQPYVGRYQNQERGPQAARLFRDGEVETVR